MAVQIGLGAGGTWHLIRSASRWSLEPGQVSAPTALVELSEAMAWRQLTGLPVPDDSIHIEGPDHLVRPLLQVRGIIA